MYVVIADRSSGVEGRGRLVLADRLQERHPVYPGVTEDDAILSHPNAWSIAPRAAGSVVTVEVVVG